jgi:hypothetical protein
MVWLQLTFCITVIFLSMTHFWCKSFEIIIFDVTKFDVPPLLSQKYFWVKNRLRLIGNSSASNGHYKYKLMWLRRIFRKINSSLVGESTNYCKIFFSKSSLKKDNIQKLIIPRKLYLWLKETFGLLWTFKENLGFATLFMRSKI